MKEEDELFKKMRDKKSIHGTRGYFDNFSKELMNKIAGEGTNFCSARNNNYLATYQALDIYGSYVCGLMFSVRVVVGPPKQDTPNFYSSGN